MKSILKISANDALIASIEREQVPVSRQWTMRIDGPTAVCFEDQSGAIYRHDVPATSGWLFLSVFVQENLACLASALASPRQTREPDAPLEDDEIGVRFQPFFLSGADDVPDLAGEGLFARGLHFSGTITPSNITLSCRCDSCARSFLARSFHTGWLGETYFYSTSGRFTLVTDIRVGETRVGMSQPDYTSMPELEEALPLAPDGSTFSYPNPFRCPHCAAAYIDFQAHPALRETEYYGLRLMETPLLRFPLS